MRSNYVYVKLLLAARSTQKVMNTRSTICSVQKIQASKHIAHPPRSNDPEYPRGGKNRVILEVRVIIEIRDVFQFLKARNK